MIFDYILYNTGKGKGKAIQLQPCKNPQGSRRLRLPEFLDNRHMKVVRLSAVRTGCLYPPPGDIPFRGWIDDSHSGAGRIKLIKNTNDPLGNRTRDRPPVSTVPQPTAPPRTPTLLIIPTQFSYCTYRAWCKIQFIRPNLPDVRLVYQLNTCISLRQTSWTWDPKVIFCIMRFGGVNRWIPGFSLIAQFKRHVETSQSFLPLSKLTLQVEQ